MKIEIKNTTVKKLEKIMKDYAKIYNNVELKYDFANKKAILTLSSRCKIEGNNKPLTHSSMIKRHKKSARKTKKKMMKYKY